jgi:hypothetical protein
MPTFRPEFFLLDSRALQEGVPDEQVPSWSPRALMRYNGDEKEGGMPKEVHHNTCQKTCRSASMRSPSSPALSVTPT